MQGTTDVVSQDPASRWIEQQTWISSDLEKKVQGTIALSLNKLGGPGLRSFLHGHWLHEPLHAVLTDVPVGSWTATVAFDAIAALGGGSKLDTAADATLIVGLVGAVGAAVTGMNDWAEVRKPAARKIGLVHATLNVAATGLFVGSCVARARKGRSSGRALAALGYLLTAASAHLGGNLIYEHQIGVRQE